MEGDEMVEACGARRTQRADHAARRTGENRAHGLTACDRRRDASARRLHDTQARRMGLETLKVCAHQWLKISIDRDGRGTLVLAVLWKNLVRDGERHA